MFKNNNKNKSFGVEGSNDSSLSSAQKAREKLKKKMELKKSKKIDLQAFVDNSDSQSEQSEVVNVKKRRSQKEPSKRSKKT